MQDSIVYDQVNSDQTHRTIRLSESYTDALVRELYAFFRAYGVQLNKVTNDKKPLQFRISTEEMDILAATWIKFREDCITAKEAEEKRQAEVKSAAMKIVEECPAIKIEAETTYCNGLYWEIGVEGLYFHEEAGSVDQLFEHVTNARDRYQEHINTLAQAHKLAKEHGITITQNDYPNTTQKSWHVSIQDINRRINWHHPYRADNAHELLEHVKDAIDFLQKSAVIG